MTHDRPADAPIRTALRDRIAWVCYALIFLALPFLVLVFRLQMQAWHYYLAGGLFVAGAVVILAVVVAD